MQIKPECSISHFFLLFSYFSILAINCSSRCLFKWKRFSLWGVTVTWAGVILILILTVFFKFTCKVTFFDSETLVIKNGVICFLSPFMFWLRCLDIALDHTLIDISADLFFITNLKSFTVLHYETSSSESYLPLHSIYHANYQTLVSEALMVSSVDLFSV